MNQFSFSPLRAKWQTKRERGRQKDKLGQLGRKTIANLLFFFSFFFNNHVTAKLYIIQYSYRAFIVTILFTLRFIANSSF
jgi:hypothetical protein